MTSDFDLKGKAMEFWLYKDEIQNRFYDIEQIDPAYIHVIEYSAYDKLRADLEVAKAALRFVVSREPANGVQGFACTYCDMGGAGYSSRGDGHHDDLLDICPVVKAQEALAKLESKE